MKAGTLQPSDARAEQAELRRLKRELEIVKQERGSPYASHDYQKLRAKEHIQVSLSRSGNCYDNAMLESFFATLKAECVDL